MNKIIEIDNDLIKIRNKISTIIRDVEDEDDKELLRSVKVFVNNFHDYLYNNGKI